MNTESLFDASEAITIKGNVRIIQRDAAGNIHYDKEQSNTIVLGIRPIIVKLLGGYNQVTANYRVNSGSWLTVPAPGSTVPVNGNVGFSVDYSRLPFVSSIAFGSSSAAATIYDTALKAPITGAERVLSVAPVIDSSGLKATFAIVIGDNDLNNITFREAVLKAQDGTVVARTPIGEHSKIAGMFFEFYWTIGYEA